MEDGIRPNQEAINSIRNFPRPTNISGVRSWFGLIEQVAYAFSKTSVMLPFKPLLAQNAEFFWGDKLQESFIKAKEEIINQIKAGVKNFDIK